MNFPITTSGKDVNYSIYKDQTAPISQTQQSAVGLTGKKEDMESSGEDSDDLVREHQKRAKNNEASQISVRHNSEAIPGMINAHQEDYQDQITDETRSIPQISEDVGVPDATWQRWFSRLTPDDLFFNDDKRFFDDPGDFDLQILAPLGRGVSGSVYICKIIRNRRDPSLDGILLAVKIYKKDQVSISQSSNEMLMIPYVQRISGTSRKSIFPTICHATRIRGHPALIMNLCGPTLFQVIGVRNYIGLPLHVIRTILTQLLQGMMTLEERGIVHADIKPENVLISMSRFGNLRSFSEYTSKIAQISQGFVRDDYEAPGSLDVVLIDWSSSSTGFNQPAPYVQSRFYRAPEVLLRLRYGPSADAWSLGCLAAEMFLGSPLFPGGDEIDMLRQIQLKLGVLPASLSRKVGDASPARHSDEWRIDPSMYVPGNFEIFLRERSGRDDFDFLAFINILRLMLQLNPDARITAASAMLHPFITGSTGQQPRRAISRRDSMMDNSTSSAHGGGRGQRAQRRLSKSLRTDEMSSEFSQT